MTPDGFYHHVRAKRETGMGTATKIIGVVVSSIALSIALGTIIYKAGRMPDADDLKEVRDKTETKIEAVQADVAGIEREQIRIRSAVESIQTNQAAMTQKLDRALDPRRRER